MKKGILSAFVIVSFVIYSLNQRRSEPVASTTVAPIIQDNQTNSNGMMMQSNVSMNKKYRDGRYRGNVADAFYGNVQVEVVIANGEINAVNFLDHPSHRETSIMINQQAMPILETEAIAVQSAKVDVVTGATYTSKAFIESLGNALKQAT